MRTRGGTGQVRALTLPLTPHNYSRGQDRAVCSFGTVFVHPALGGRSLVSFCSGPGRIWLVHYFDEPISALLEPKCVYWLGSVQVEEELGSAKQVGAQARSASSSATDHDQLKQPADLWLHLHLFLIGFIRGRISRISACLSGTSCNSCSNDVAGY
jgi:hypothetical protein